MRTLLQSNRVRVLGALPHAELDLDVEAVGRAATDVRRPQPVVNGVQGHVADGVDPLDVALAVRVAGLPPLCVINNERRSEEPRRNVF